MAPEQISVIETAEDVAQQSAKEEDEQGETICTSWRDRRYMEKFIYTVFLAIAFSMLGVCIGQRGPSFLDLQIITDTDVERGSAFFTAGSDGYLVGSLICGIVYDKFNKILTMFLLTLCMGVSTGILPFCSLYGLMVAIHLVTGAFMGGVDTCGNAELVRTWGSNGRSAMQTTHFAFAFGGVISPLMTQPFLSPLRDETNATTAPPGVGLSGMNITVTSAYNISSNSTLAPTEEKQTTIVFYAYIISAVLTTFFAFPFLISYCREKSQTKKRTAGEDTSEPQSISRPVFVFTIAMICVTYMLYCAVEDSFAAYLVTFVVKHLRWSKSRGTELTSAYWASFAGGRFLGIFFVKFITPVKLLFICCFSLIASLVAFLFCAQYDITIGIWISSVTTGLSMSVFFPTGLTWTEEELLNMSGRVASAILIASSSGTMANPIILGYLMNEHSLMWYAYLLTVESIACLLMFIILLIYARTFLKKRKQSAVITIELKANGPSSQVEEKFL
ncbi:sodium-dependent glucose transporter 1A-like [Haliotis rubra]|uniref:sodium-dependent glucose transporter 1A-like n=1 Tax=Haliotis rubra TaxID=36100 RepID=UPI001EE52A2D|nr:sodium-dependent glucose transporter 1A-like [Haliotis rubra]XP_046543217.1 sodium-dependent glucose transporter 1A-like [Haliotis rubra]XP_046543218.1 sodium-dependent glucose transporter 1A-like [Haliotis rubra]XP_046543219.1 sodium-dependent glucose transporter 1A-like [Haliotis rubra]